MRFATWLAREVDRPESDFVGIFAKGFVEHCQVRKKRISHKALLSYAATIPNSKRILDVAEKEWQRLHEVGAFNNPWI